MIKNLSTIFRRTYKLGKDGNIGRRFRTNENRAQINAVQCVLGGGTT